MGAGVARSLDGITWLSANDVSSINAVVWDSAQFVVVGSDGAIATSTTGEAASWAQRASDSIVLGNFGFTDIIREH